MAGVVDGTWCLSAMDFGLKGECGKPSRNSDPSVRGLLYQTGAAWMRDVALEIWIDVERVPVNIRLAGTFDETTSVSLISVVKELIADGRREFELQTPALYVPDESGVSSLMELERAVESSGGRLMWDGCTLTRPPALRADPRWASAWSESKSANQCRGSQPAEPSVRSMTDPPLSIERGSPGVGTR